MAQRQRSGWAVGPVWLALVASLLVIGSAYGGRIVDAIALGPATIAVFLLPGLFLLGILRSPSSEPTGHVVKAVGLSLALLMLTGLLLNSVLPLVGVSRPLAKPEVLVAVVVLLVSLGIGADRRMTVGSSRWPWPPFRLRLASVQPVTLIAAALVPAAVIGAALINANGSRIVSVTTEVIVALLAPWLLLSRRRRSDATYAWILFCQAAALLLLTSLRGDYISGHDILYEFSIFTTTLQHSRWSMNYLHSPYNACLSITILPVMLFRLLTAMGSQYIFRVLFQLIFALTPVASFTIARRFAEARWAYAAGFVFLASAALVTDFPYLTRQEIALFIFGALIVALGQSRSGTWERRIVLALLGAGIVVSHYSTAYATAAIMLIALAVAVVIRLLRRDAVSRSDLGYVTVGFTASLTIAVVFWQAVLTRATGNLSGFLKSAIQNIWGKGSLLTGSPSYQDLLQSFVSSSAHRISEPGGYYPTSSYRGYSPSTRISPYLPSRLPPLLTEILVKLGEVSRLTLQGLMVVGCGLLIVKAVRKKGPVDFAALSFGALVLAAAAYVVPAVGQYYSPLRIEQQVLVILGTTFIVVVSAAASRWSRKIVAAAVAGLVTLAFLASSPLSSQYIGTPWASLQLNNFGLYYDLYYTHTSDLRAIDWLATHTTANDVVYADTFAARRIATFSPHPISVVNNVLPRNISRDGFVFEDVDNVTRGVAYDFIDGQIVPYRFPTAFVKDHKRLVFSDGNVRIYR